MSDVEIIRAQDVASAIFKAVFLGQLRQLRDPALLEFFNSHSMAVYSAKSSEQSQDRKSVVMIIKRDDENRLASFGMGFDSDLFLATERSVLETDMSLMLGTFSGKLVQFQRDGWTVDGMTGADFDRLRRMRNPGASE